MCPSWNMCPNSKCWPYRAPPGPTGPHHLYLSISNSQNSSDCRWVCSLDIERNRLCLPQRCYRRHPTPFSCEEKRKTRKTKQTRSEEWTPNQIVIEHFLNDSQKKNIKNFLYCLAPDLWQTGTSCSTLRPNLAFPLPQQIKAFVVFGACVIYFAMGSKFGHTKRDI